MQKLKNKSVALHTCCAVTSTNPANAPTPACVAGSSVAAAIYPFVLSLPSRGGERRNGCARAQRVNDVVLWGLEKNTVTPAASQIKTPSAAGDTDLDQCQHFAIVIAWSKEAQKKRKRSLLLLDFPFTSRSSPHASCTNSRSCEETR